MRPFIRLGWLLLLSVVALSQPACESRPQPLAANAKPAPPAAPPGPDYRPAAAHRLGNTDLYVSLPQGFALKATDGPDFLVYYFAPADTTVRADFSGGLYVGSQPQGDVAATAGCGTRRAAATLLGHPATFTIHRCATGYSVSSVFASHSGRGWDAQVDAFGEAKSAAGLRQLLAVFATLRRQPAK